MVQELQFLHHFCSWSAIEEIKCCFFPVSLDNILGCLALTGILNPRVFCNNKPNHPQK